MENKRKETGSVGYLGTYLLMELRECDLKVLRNLSKVKNILISAAKEAKATIVEVSFRKFKPLSINRAEISGVVIIAESHIAIDTWPECSGAVVEIFTCGDLIKPEVAAKYIARELKSKDAYYDEKKKGEFPLAEGALKLKHKPDGAESPKEVCVQA